MNDPAQFPVPASTAMLRPANRREITWTALGAVILAGLAAWYISRLDPAAPAAARLIAVVLLVAGPLATLESLRWPAPTERERTRLTDLEPVTARSVLRRQLLAGRPGPPETRQYAWDWAARRLRRRRGSTGLWMFLAGWNIAFVLDIHNGPSTWSWWFLPVPLALFAAGVLEAFLNVRARQVVAALLAEQPTDTGDEPGV